MCYFDYLKKQMAYKHCKINTIYPAIAITLEVPKVQVIQRSKGKISKRKAAENKHYSKQALYISMC